MVAEITNDPRLIRKLRTLEWLPAERVDRLAQATTIRRVHRHQTIFFEGASATDVFLLLSGVAKLTLLNADERILVALVGPGEIFGVSSLLRTARRPFRCDAFSDCLVGTTTPEAFVEATLGVKLEHLSPMLEITVGRWWAMVLRYTNFVGLALRERLAGALLELGSKFGADDARGRLLTLKLTHSDLAELVGASRQRITEQLSEFERAGVIIRDGRRLIIVPDRLLAVTHGEKSPDSKNGGGTRGKA